MVRFTKTDKRESPAGYEAQTRFERALAIEGGMDSPAYLAAVEEEKKAGELIKAVLDEHGADAMILPCNRTSMWAMAAYAQVIG